MISVAWACHIHGTDSGVCSFRYLPSTYMNETVNEKKAREIAKSQWANGTDGSCMQGEGDHCMPFCGKYIAAYYPVCVPKTQAFDGDHNFPRGRFKYHTVQSKDRWVERTVASMIEQRIALETNKTARQLGVDEHGKPGKTRVRFHKNRDCQEAYKRYFCYLNFPRCGKLLLKLRMPAALIYNNLHHVSNLVDDFEQSLPLCQSVCQNFFRACGMEEDLWRCNEIVDNQITASEKAQDHFFPGAPFKKNEYNRRNMPTDVCTPSIKGASTLSRPYSFLLRFISLCSTLVLVFLS